jgi:signal peptidase I
MAKEALSKSPGAISHLLTIIVTIFAVLTSWKFLCYATNSSSPVLVVISGSMEPTYHRGDILFLWNNTETVEIGEVAACWFEGYPLPMVHRVIQKSNPQKYIQIFGLVEI